MMPTRPSVVVPPALAPGARVAVISPGAPPVRRRVEAGLAILQGWGYAPELGPHVFARQGDLAGDDDARAADLRWALETPGIAAVWATRGGWGTARLLGRLNWARVVAHPRWVIGFSDLTVLQSALLDRGVASLHAPLVAELARKGRYGVADLRSALASPLTEREFRPGPRKVLAPGRARGFLAGGCLTLLAALAGTPWQPRLDGAVVFLEEVREAPYRVDRLLWQLRAAGMLDGVAGLVFGHFTRCAPEAGRPSRRLADVLREHAAGVGAPALAGIPMGHGARARALHLGYSADLDAKRGVLRLTPPPAAP